MIINEGGQILEALKARLETIRTSNNYDIDVQMVRLNETEPSLNAAEADLPLIEIFNDGDDYEHNAGSSYWCDQRVFLYLVAKKDRTDSDMEQFKSNIIAALFGGTADATGNLGITLGGKVQSISLIGSSSDLNMIQSNRVYILKISLRSHRTTYRG